MVKNRSMGVGQLHTQLKVNPSPWITQLPILSFLEAKGTFHSTSTRLFTTAYNKDTYKRLRFTNFIAQAQCIKLCNKIPSLSYRRGGERLVSLPNSICHCTHVTCYYTNDKIQCLWQEQLTYIILVFRNRLLLARFIASVKISLHIPWSFLEHARACMGKGLKLKSFCKMTTPASDIISQMN